MDKFLMYISYDEYDWINYYQLVINDELIGQPCPEERVDDILKTVIEKGSEVKKFELYIVQDEDVSYWDYDRKFKEYDMELFPVNGSSLEELCLVMHTVFGGEYSIDGKDDTMDKKKINVLYSGKCSVRKNQYKDDKTLSQAKEILDSCEKEMTELARIIIEKYERMKQL